MEQAGRLRTAFEKEPCASWKRRHRAYEYLSRQTEPPYRTEGGRLSVCGTICPSVFVFYASGLLYQGEANLYWGIPSYRE